MWQSCAIENEIEIQLPHIRLSGRLWGAQDKPLLLALHGWLDNANSFLPLAQHLKDYRILAIDWPGHGGSEHRPGHYPLHWVDYLYDLDVLLAHLLAEHRVVAILGHSLGGIVAAAYTAAFPHRVENLVLIEALAPLYEEAEKARQRLKKSFAGHLRYLNNIDKPLSIYPDMTLAVSARHKLTALDVSWCELLTKRNMQQTDSGVCWRSDPRLKLDSPLRLSLAQVEALMQSHEARTLLISGQGGFEQLQQAMPTANRWFKRLTPVSLPGDHHLHMGNARQVSMTIDDFLSKRNAKISEKRG